MNDSKANMIISILAYAIILGLVCLVLYVIYKIYTQEKQKKNWKMKKGDGVFFCGPQDTSKIINTDVDGDGEWVEISTIVRRHLVYPK